MTFSEAVNHYTKLLRDSASFAEALSWTVIRPLDKSIALDAVAARLIGGGHPLLTESDDEFTEEAEFSEGYAVYMGRSGEAVMLVEPGGFSYASIPQVMAWLSQDAQVWHLSWNHTGSRVLEYAANGQRLARIPELDPHAIHGADPAALQEEAAALEETRNASWPVKKATAMAIIERRTGARLPMDWFDQPRLVAIVDPLINDECPPIGLEHYEPDMHVQLQSAPPEYRQAVLLQVIDVLVERFDLGLTAITRAVRVAHAGQPLDGALLEEVREEWVDLGARWAGRGYAVREEDENTWRRWVAVNAIRHSLRSLNEGASFFDGLTYARFALSENWPEIRAGIRGIIRDVSN
ncbi:hypothetical protein AB0D67_37270 [Streptosporangium sp. NPDC048047]|uniref:hypothetical protein n=1 Tax=Streptosporangium sp. NPDC048047 TaxID=3155748 RepID=UPI003449BA2F